MEKRDSYSQTEGVSFTHQEFRLIVVINENGCFNYEATEGILYLITPCTIWFMDPLLKFLRQQSNISEVIDGNSWNSLVFRGNMPVRKPGILEFMNETLGFKWDTELPLVPLSFELGYQVRKLPLVPLRLHSAMA